MTTKHPKYGPINALVEELVARLQQTGLSMRQISLAIDLSPSMVGNYCIGRTVPSHEAKEKLVSFALQAGVEVPAGLLSESVGAPNVGQELRTAFAAINALRERLDEIERAGSHPAIVATRKRDAMLVSQLVKAIEASSLLTTMISEIRLALVDSLPPEIPLLPTSTPPPHIAAPDRRRRLPTP